MLRKTFLVLTCIVLFSSASLAAESIAALKAKAEQGDAESQYRLASHGPGWNKPEEAQKISEYWFLSAAEQGYLKAQTALCKRYGIGPGDAEDIAKWCLSAANQGAWEAQLKLADLYEQGVGVSRNYEEAAKWWRKSLKSGEALYRLGRLYVEGKGVPQDYSEAFDLFYSAAMANDADSQYQLGKLYAEGHGAKQSYEDAYFWYSLASRPGVGRENINASAVIARDDAAGRLTPQQIIAAHKEFLSWKSNRLIKTLKYGMDAADYISVISVLLLWVIPVIAVVYISRQNMLPYRDLAMGFIAILYPFSATLIRNSLWQYVDTFFERLAEVSGLLSVALHFALFFLPGVIILFLLPTQKPRGLIGRVVVSILYLIIMIPLVIIFYLFTYCTFNRACVMP